MIQVPVFLLGSERGRERFRKRERERARKHREEPWGENRRDMERAGDRTRKSSDGKQRDGEGVTKQSVTIAREPASQSEATRERERERERERKRARERRKPGGGTGRRE